MPPGQSKQSNAAKLTYIAALELAPGGQHNTAATRVHLHSSIASPCCLPGNNTADLSCNTSFDVTRCHNNSQPCTNLCLKILQLQGLASRVVIQRDEVATVLVDVAFVTHRKGDAICHLLSRLAQLQRSEKQHTTMDELGKCCSAGRHACLPVYCRCSPKSL